MTNLLPKIPAWLFAAALFIAAVILVFQILVRGQPLNCGSTWFPKSCAINQNIVTRVIAEKMTNRPIASEITGSSGAAFCALTVIDDDTPDGSCSVSQKADGTWIGQTGGGGGDNSCTVTCLFIE